MTVELIPNIVDGKAVHVANTQRTPVFNPSQGKLIAETPQSGLIELDEAVQSAERAYRDWSNVPVTSRTKILFRYLELLQKHSEELSQLITVENGKTLEEARGDVLRGVEVVEFACGMILDEHLQADVAIVDYELSISMPQTLTAHVGIDTFSHGLEAYVSRKASPLTDPIALSCLQLCCNHLIAAYEHGGNVVAREGMMMAALQGGMAFSNSSVCLIHGMSRPRVIAGGKLAMAVFGRGLRVLG